MISQSESLLARKSGSKSILSSRQGGVCQMAFTCQNAHLVKGLSKYSELLDEDFGGARQAEMNIWAAVTVTVSKSNFTAAPGYEQGGSGVQPRPKFSTRTRRADNANGPNVSLWASAAQARHGGRTAIVQPLALGSFFYQCFKNFNTKPTLGRLRRWP
jgi:hypothetical protein